MTIELTATLTALLARWEAQEAARKLEASGQLVQNAALMIAPKSYQIERSSSE
ncbi:MAG: hypothetical protein ABI970_18540 [Chloroflexota bacterium]